jgi:hypothetical protein
MVKLYTPFKNQIPQEPSKKAIQFILDFAASHRSVAVDNSRVDILLN